MKFKIDEEKNRVYVYPMDSGARDYLRRRWMSKADYDHGTVFNKIFEPEKWVEFKSEISAKDSEVDYSLKNSA